MFDFVLHPLDWRVIAADRMMSRKKQSQVEPSISGFGPSKSLAKRDADWGKRSQAAPSSARILCLQCLPNLELNSSREQEQSSSRLLYLLGRLISRLSGASALWRRFVCHSSRLGAARVLPARWSWQNGGSHPALLWCLACWANIIIGRQWI